MRMSNLRYAAAFAVVAAATACDTPTVEIIDHVVPAGVVIRQVNDTALIARSIRLSDRADVTGQIGVVLGETTPELRVIFINNVSTPLTLTGDYYVVTNVANDLIATWTPTAAGEFRGTVTGTQVGSTTIGLTLFHGTPGSGHQAGLGFNIPIVVTAPAQ